MSISSSNEAKWYVVHTYSGYENKVKTNLEKIIENRGSSDLIMEVRVPVEKIIETNEAGVQKEVEVKIFPSYVLVKMIMTDFSWYIVRNTRGVTGFVGPGSKPVPLTEEEIERLGLAHKEFQLNYEVGDSVTITSESFRDFVGIVEEIDLERQKVKVSVSMFGRETPLELELNQVEPLE